MSLDMYGAVDPVFESTPSGGVELITQQPGTYGAGGEWQAGAESTETLTLVNIQPADKRTADFYMEYGGTMQPLDLRVIYINDGVVIEPDDDGAFSQLFRFSDGSEVRDWRVREADNRPWRNYTKVVVERYRGSA
jgi:hypothetical protein